MNPNNSAAIEAEVLKKIHEATSAVLPWFDADPEMMDWLPQGSGWSISEILAHITLTSHYLLILIKKGEAKALKAKDRREQPPLPDTYELIPEKLAEAGLFQAFAWHRPEHMDPRTHAPEWPIRQRFFEQMHICEETLRQLEGGWGTAVRTTMTVNEIGKLDVYQYIVFLCNHAMRHVMQMESVREQFNRAR